MRIASECGVYLCFKQILLKKINYRILECSNSEPQLALIVASVSKISAEIRLLYELIFPFHKRQLTDNWNWIQRIRSELLKLRIHNGLTIYLNPFPMEINLGGVLRKEQIPGTRHRCTRFVQHIINKAPKKWKPKFVKRKKKKKVTRRAISWDIFFFKLLVFSWKPHITDIVIYGIFLMKNNFTLSSMKSKRSNLLWPVTTLKTFLYKFKRAEVIRSQLEENVINLIQSKLQFQH